MMEVFLMKACHLPVWLVTIFLLSFLGLAIDGQAANVRIEFDNPNRFTDFRIQGWTELDSAKIFSRDISNYLSPVVARRFPGATLTLHFTDIDLTGLNEQWRGPIFNNVRTVRGFTPLRLYFDYSITNGNGQVIAHGRENLVDVDFFYRYAYLQGQQRNSRLFYEAQDLSRWLRMLRE
ncbi:MAG: DUF3016 domain-containing protein [Verrucomicrobia bacterium]|nr:DUF3016 domain-containing protein [Verrucomicrobiota bacterium]